MEFPVDLLADYSQGEQERLSEEYMKSILCTNPDALQKVTLANRTQVSIGITNVGFVPLYGTNDKQKVLALFCPSDQLTAVALYLRNRWWTIDEILKTGDTARDGILQVQTVGERVVLYTLNRVVYRAHEMSSEELPFLCHGEKDYAKVLWKNGEAVGFYSVKPPGSLCSALSTQCYQLPVMDSIFVRKCHRGNSFGVQMLEDFVSSFKDDCLGLRYPVSKAMFKVCETYLSQYPGDRDVLWQVEGVGSPSQRTNIANKIHTMNMSVSRNLSFTEKSIVSSEVTETDVVMEEIASHNKNNESVEYTVQISEEVTVVRAAKVSELDEIPVTTRVRSTGLKQRKMREETEEVSSTPTPDTTVLTPSEVPEKIEANMKQTLLDEEPQTLEVTSEIPKLQRAMVVIVDLKASCHEPQVEEMEEMTHIKKNIPAEKTDEEVAPSTVETQALRSKTKAVAEIPQKRRPLRERPEVDYEEARDDEIETAAVIDSNKDSVSVGDEEDNMKTVEAAPSTIEAQMDAALIEEALMAETDKELKKMAVVDTHEKEEMQCEETDEVSINFTSETAVTTLNEVPEQAEVGVSSSEEAEAPVAATRTLRDRKKTVEATPTRKSTRQKQVEEKKEKEVAAMESSNGKEEPVVERVLRRGRKSAAAEATPSSKSTISKQQEEKKDKEKTTVETNNDKEETVVETRGRRRGRPPKSAPGTPKCESKILSKQQKEAEVEEKEQSTTAEDIKVQEEDATVETIAEIEPKRDKETEAENTEQESETPEDESEEPEIEAEKEHTKENEVEKDKGEGVEAVTPEVEPAPVSVEEEEEVEGVTQEPLVSAVEMVEDEIVPSEEAEEVSPTPSPVSAMVTPSEPAPVSVEEKELVEGVTQETLLAKPATEESQEDVGVESVGDEIVQNEEAEEVSPEPTPDTAVVTASELAPASVEEEQQVGVKQETPLEEPETEESQEVSAVERVEDEIANNDTDVVSPIEVSGNIDDTLTQIPDVSSLGEVPQQAEVGVSSSEEAEAPVATTRTLRDRKKTVEATPRRKSSRNKQVEEKEVAAIESSNDKEEPVVETRVLRRGRKSAPAEATLSSKSTRSKQQEEKKGKEETAVETNNDMVEPVSETRVLRRGRKSAPVAPRRESKRVHKQQKESEVEEKEESTTAEDIKVQEEDATVETPEETKEPTMDKETEGENTEQESGTREDGSEKNEILAEKEHTEETEEEKDEGEGVEAEIPEVEPAPVSVEGEEEVEGVTQEPPLEEPATEESQEVAAVEMVEDEIIPSAEAEEVSPTPSPDSAIVTPSETAPVYVEEEDKVGVTQDTPLAEPATEMTQTPADEEPQKEVTSQIPKLQRASVVLLDLKATCHDPQIEEIEETTPIQQIVSTEKTDEEAAPSVVEEKVQMEAAVTEEPMAETDEDQTQMTAVVKEIVQNEETDEMSTNLTTDSAVTTPTEVPEQAKTGVSSSEEAETPVAATRTLRDRKKSVEATPKSKSTRHKQQEEDKEEPVVETRVLRRGRKSAPAEATPSSKSTRSKQQEEKKDKEATVVETKNDKEEPVVETTVQRRGRPPKSASGTPKRESKRVSKQQKEAEVEEQEESTSAEEIKLQEEDATVETQEPTTDEVKEGENTEQESGTPENQSEEPEIEAEKEHTEENEVEKEKGEGVEAETPEVEPAPVSVEGEEEVEGFTQEPPLAEPATEESQEVAAVEMVEDEIVPSEEGEEVSPTPSPDSAIVTPSETAPVSVEEEEKVGVTQDTPLAEPATEMTQTPADEEPQKEVTSQIPKLQRASVVLVDLKATCHDPQIEEIEETTPIQQIVSPEKTDEEAAPSVVEEKVQMEAAVTEEPMAETDKDQNQMTAAVETRENETVQNEDDDVSTNLTTDSAVPTLTEVPEQATIGVSSSEEAETTVAATRTLRDRKGSVEATPKRKSTRHKQQEDDKEKPVVEAKVLRRGRKSAPAEATPSPKSTRSKQQEEKKDKEATVVETKNDKEEPVVETTVRRRGRPPKSASGTPKRESKRVSKQQKEAEVEEQEESTSAEEIKLQEEDATVETQEPTTDEVIEGENTEQESETPENQSEEPEIEADKEHTEENEVEKEKGEGVEAETPEVEPAPVSVEGEEEVEGVTQEPPLAGPATEESQEVAAVEMVEDEIVPSEEAEEVSPTPSPDSAIVTPSETAPVSVEEEEKVGVTQDTPLAEPATEMTQTPADEEPQKEVTSQIPKLQRASVVLVDLKATCHDPQIEEIEETTPIQQIVSAEKTDEEAAPSVVEENVQMEAAVTEEPMAETDKDQNQMTAAVETRENETVQNEDDDVSTNLTTDSAVPTQTEVPEQAKIGVSSSEEAETPVASTRTLRDRKISVEATPKRKSTRHKQQEEDKEEPVVETRVLRRGRKSAPSEATPSKSTRSKQQEEEKDKEAAVVETKNDKEEPVVETRVLRRGRKSAPVALRRESKRVHKQQKEAEVEEQEESTIAEEIKLQEEDATVEAKEPMTDKETEAENTEQESGTPEDQFEEPEIEAEKEHTEENGVEKEKGDGVEAETPEVEPASVSVEGEEEVEGVTQEPPLAEPVTEESQEVAAVEMVEDEIVPSEEAEEVSPTPSPDSAIVTPSETAPVSVEEEEKVGMTQETPLAELVAEESQKVAAVDKVGDETNNEETVEESSALIPDTAVVIPSEVPETIEESTTQTLADEEPQREIPSQIPKLQRASVVLVDLKTSCHDRQVEEIEETTPIQQNVSAEKTDEKAPPSAIEEEVEMQAAVAEEPMAETDTDKKQMTAVVETFEKEIVQNEETDEMSTNLTTDSAVTTPTEVPEQAKIGVSSSEEAETPVASTSTLRDRKKSVEATPKRKSTRHKQQEEEKEEPVVETRVLRRGRKSAPAEATPSPKSTRSKQQEEKKDKEAAVVETKNSKEEPVVETTVLRRGRKSAPVAPKRESKRVRKQQKEAEDEEQEESITKAQEENFTVETPEETDKSKTVKEAEGENIEPEESGTPEDESKEPELEVLKENNKENEVETEKGEGVEAETQTTEVEPAPVSVKEEEKVEGVTEETPLAEPATEKSQEVSLVERVEDEIVHIVEAEEVSTTPNPDSAMVTPSEPATVSVEEQVGVTQETPLAEPATKESQEVTAVERVEDEITNNEETEEVGSTPAPDTAVVTPHEVPENIEDSMTQTPADEEPQKEVACQIPKLCENEIVQIEETNEVSTNVTTDCILTALSEVPEQAEIGVSSSEEAEVAVATTRTMRERKKAVEPAPRRKSTRKLEENKHEEEVAVESSNDEEEPVVETRVLRRGRKPASVKSTPIRKSTGSNPEEKKDEDEQVVEINNDKEEPVVETRVLRRGRKSAPVAPRRESKRVRKQLNEAEDEEQEEPTAEDIKVQEENATVETPAEIEDYKTDKETEGENIEQESVIPEDESEEPEIEAEKEHTKENELESEKREGVEPEPTPVSVEEEEQVEAVTQDPPLAEPATEESQEVAVGERLDDEMKQQQGEEKEEEEPVEAESQEAESPVVETRALRCRTKAVADSPQIKSKRRRLEVEEVGEVKPTKRRSVRGKPEVDYNENNEDEEAAPVSVEEEEQIEGVTQVAPLAEPATEESQEVAAVERVDDEIVQNEEAEDMSPTPKLQRTTVVLVDLKSTCQEPHVEHIDGTTPETKRRSMRERPEVDYDENSDDDIKTVSAEAVIDSNDEEDNVTELTANEETEKPVDEDTPQKRRSMRQKPEVDYDENKVTELTASEETEKPEEEEAANGIDVTNSISGESEEDNIIQLALEEDEEEEKAETAEEEGADELAISEESLIVGKRMLRGKKTSPPVTHSPSPKSQKVETRALRNRTKADADTPKIKSKRRHLDEEEVEEVEPPKRRSTRQRPEVDYSEDGDKTCPPVTLSSSAEPRRQSTKGKKAAQERKESSSDEEQEKISPSDKKRIVRKRTSIEPTPVRRSKRATNISE